MPNPGQPTIRPGASGDVVRRLQRALRRTPELELQVDGIFGPLTETLVINFQKAASLSPDGVVGPLTWQGLPDGGPMPLLAEGSTGDVVRHLQTVLTSGPGQSGTPRRVSTATSARAPALAFRHSKDGAGSAWTGSSVTRPGRCRCRRCTPRWSPS